MFQIIHKNDILVIEVDYENEIYLYGFLNEKIDLSDEEIEKKIYKIKLDFDYLLIIFGIILIIFDIICYINIVWGSMLEREVKLSKRYNDCIRDRFKRNYCLCKFRFL